MKVEKGSTLKSLGMSLHLELNCTVWYIIHAPEYLIRLWYIFY
jgi:hypothetical protein